MKAGGGPRSRASRTCSQGTCSRGSSLVPMVDQILAGGATSLVNLVIHALVMGVLIKLLLKLSDRATGASPFLAYPVIIVATGSVLFAAHFAEVLLWAYTYAAVGAAPPGTDLVYFAFGNYTTLGYGDV